MRTRYCPFPNTHWSLVQRAGMAEEQARREALATLLARYEPALRSYLRLVRRMPSMAAEDLAQSFIADKVLADDLLRHADQGRGRFRTFLLTSLNNYATSRQRSQAARERAQDAVTARDETAEAPAIEAVVDAEWARALVHSVLKQMKGNCETSGRTDVWAVFESRILREIFTRERPEAYEDLAARLKLASPTQAANLLVTGKRMYARLLRDAVAEYERDDAAIEREIAELLRVLEGGGAPRDDGCAGGDEDSNRETRHDES